MKYRLDEIATIKYGKNQKKVVSEDGTIPIYGTGGLMGYATQALYDKPSVLIGRKGTIDKVRYVTHPFWTVDTLFYTVVNEKVVRPHFFYYLVSALDLAKFNEGTTIPSLRTETLNRIEFEVPAISVQDNILSVLEPIEAKIELNERINKNLEAQAQIIFTERFVNNVYEIVKVTNLGSVCECALGGTPSRAKPEFWNGNIPWINSGEVNRFRITSPSELITQAGLERSATKLLPAKTTVLAITGATLGQVSLLEIAACANQSVVGIVPNATLPYEFIYPYIKANIQELISHQTGGAQQHINKQNVEGLSVSIPSKPLLDDFVSLVSPIYAMVASNCFENMRLEQLRNSLLPQLMSGELDVSDLDL